MTFQQKLDAIIQKNNSLLCVGLDSDVRKLPEHLHHETDAQFLFNKEIIVATHDLVCSYKPNSAYYEGNGAEGLIQLEKTCRYIRETYPEIPVILDAKRGDIGSTNEGYVQYVFDYLGADAITLHAYLGKKALEPFLNHSEKGCIILCRTSNDGAEEFQDLLVEGMPLYQHVASDVISTWNENNNCLLVVGAQHPEKLKAVRAIVGDMTILVPGIGVQGGDLEATVRAGLNSKNAGIIINAGRSVIFQSSTLDFAQQARDEAIRLKSTINALRGI